MPYIRQIERDDLKNDPRPLTAGQLNYMVSVLIKRYMSTHGLSYKTINDIVGALESAKAEFQRRVVGPYEDTKIIENGDL